MTKKDLSEITNSDINSINDAIKDLKNKYSNPNSAIELNAVNNSFSLELKTSLNEFVDDLLPSDLKTSELRTLATIAIKKKILQSDLILLRGSGAYDHIKELLEKNGMPTITWKPLENEQIPKQARGLIIPGGFPEQHAKQLSNSKISLKAIKLFSKKFPIYAECGGMMLLGKSIFDLEGREHSMAGILPFKAKKGNLKIGYREATSKNKSPITSLGIKLIGHEFHRWEIINEGYNSKINPLWDLKGWNIETKNEGFCNHLIHASWVHLHWASSPLILENWKRSVMNKV